MRVELEEFPIEFKNCFRNSCNDNDIFYMRVLLVLVVLLLLATTTNAKTYARDGLRDFFYPLSSISSNLEQFTCSLS